MATPQVSGIGILLKSKNPDWSPAAIRSAIFATGWTTDPYGQPIFAKGDPTKIADSLDYGGVVNPNCAARPGLMYDMGEMDYVQYLCPGAITMLPSLCSQKSLYPARMENTPSLTENLP